MKKPLLFVLPLLLSFACGGSGNSSKGENNWIVLFDGTSTDSFRGYGIEGFPVGVWYVEDGVLITNPDSANRDLITRDRFKDFELEYEWAVDTAANSGVFFHMQETLSMESGNGNSPNWLDNFELQILDDKYFHDTLVVRSAGSFDSSRLLRVSVLCSSVRLF